MGRPHELRCAAKFSISRAPRQEDKNSFVQNLRPGVAMRVIQQLLNQCVVPAIFSESIEYLVPVVQHFQFVVLLDRRTVRLLTSSSCLKKVYTEHETARAESVFGAGFSEFMKYIVLERVPSRQALHQGRFKLQYQR